jgi:hypothetical protein
MPKSQCFQGLFGQKGTVMAPPSGLEPLTLRLIVANNNSVAAIVEMYEIRKVFQLAQFGRVGGQEMGGL